MPLLRRDRLQGTHGHFRDPGGGRSPARGDRAGEPETVIRKLSGMQPLLLDGLEKVAEGRTTLEEVLRVGLR
ncbi:MAG: hypothetical protein IPN71_12365 [Fibrobacteres bacterium]|nr:hypothetical protein [Fibrobacterota bacterium]